MSVTQKDIAEHLGVSRPWVARALSGDPRVSARSRARVEGAARALGYDARVHHHARLLVGKQHGRRVRSGVIGCAGFSFQAWRQYPYWLHLMAGMEEAAHEVGLELLLLNDPSGIGWHKMDGVLVHGDSSEAILRELPPGMAGVCLMSAVSNAPSVLADDYKGARELTEYLLQQGHRRIAYLLNRNTRVIHDRLAGYRDALRAAGIAPQEHWVRQLQYPATNTGIRQLGRENMHAWLQDDWNARGCTALLAQNDNLAVGAMDALSEAGLSVPGDVSVVGFDGTDECETVSPPLTSVAVPLHQIGREALRLLHRMIEGETVEVAPLVFPARLEARQSSAPPHRLSF